MGHHDEDHKCLNTSSLGCANVCVRITINVIQTVNVAGLIPTVVWLPPLGL